MRYASGEPLHGVVTQSLQVHRDERGSFREIFKDLWGTPLHPTQWSVVHSRENVLRGPHLHLEHDEYFLLLQGRAFVGLRDVRPGSPTRDRSCLIELTEDEETAVIFPRGFLHGWYFPVQSTHIQAVSQAYEEYHPHDNLGCLWSDPELEIPWPCRDPILANRAGSFPPLSALLERVSAAKLQ